MAASQSASQCSNCGTSWTGIPDVCPGCHAKVLAQIWLDPCPDRVQASILAERVFECSLNEPFLTPAELSHALRAGPAKVGAVGNSETVDASERLTAHGVPHRVSTVVRPNRKAPARPFREARAALPRWLLPAFIGGLVVLAATLGASYLRPRRPDVQLAEVEGMLTRVLETEIIELDGSDPPMNALGTPVDPSGADRIRASLVEMIDGRGRGVAVGDPSYILTVRGAFTGAVGDEVRVRPEVVPAGAEPIQRARIIAIDEKNELAVLRCGSEGCPLPGAPLAGSADIRQAALLLALAGRHPISGRPVVLRHRGKVTVETADGRPLYKTLIQLGKGDQGGPLIHNGHVVGLLVPDPEGVTAYAYSIPIEVAIHDGGGLLYGLTQLGLEVPAAALSRLHDRPPQVVAKPKLTRGPVVAARRTELHVRGAYAYGGRVHLEIILYRPSGSSVPQEGWVLDFGRETKRLKSVELLMKSEEGARGLDKYKFQYYGRVSPSGRQATLRLGDIESSRFRFSSIDANSDLVQVLESRVP